MPTILREGGLRIVIYTDDHPPPHVHVFGDGETKIALSAITLKPAVVRSIGATVSESRRALRIVQEHRTHLLEQWNALHG